MSLERSTLDIIRKHDKDRPISRRELVMALKAMNELEGLSMAYADRKAREAIQELRTNHPEGARIVSTSKGAGYYFAQTADEIEACMREDISRIESLNAKVRNMRRAADRMRGLRQGVLL